MNRRRFLAVSALALSTFALSACMDAKLAAALVTNHLDFGPGELQRVLDARFPRDFNAMGGLVPISVLNPRLSIPADANRLRVDFDIDLGKNYAGSFGISSGIRYDANTLGLYLQDPSIESVNVPLLGGALGGQARSALGQWLNEYARAEPIYRVDPKKLRGRTVTDAAVDNGHVVLNFAH